MQSIVYSQRCQTYESGLVMQKMSQLLKPFDSFFTTIKNKSVLLKPNLIGTASPEKALTTHPVVVETLINILKEKGARHIYLGDGPGGLEINYERVLEESGMSDILTRHKDLKLFKVEPLNYYKSKVENTTLYFPAQLKEIDIIINLPKIKTHLITLFTGAIKNLYGIIPAHKRKLLHFDNPHPNKFEEILVKLAQSLKPSINIADAIIGLQGNGPSRGFPANMGYLLASTDILSIDIASSILLGYEWRKIHHLQYAEKVGLGNPGFKIIGDEIKSGSFKLKSNTFLKFVTSLFGKHSLKLFRIYPHFFNPNCSKCHRCHEYCEFGGIMIEENDYPRRINSKCRNCLCCYEICEANAIKLKTTFFATYMTRKNSNYS